MNFKIFLASVAIFYLLAGCAPNVIHINETSIAADSKYPSYVTDIRQRVNDNGLLDVQVTFFSSKTRNIEYKVEWLDENGFALRNPIDDRYRSLILIGNENLIVQKTASDKRARSVKIHINNSRGRRE